MSRNGRDEILGLAHSDHDLVVFLEAAGVLSLEKVIDDPRWVRWRGAAALMSGRGLFVDARGFGGCD
ncbi:hypothetical protein AB0F96_14650 [Streptomyces sp. NPDC023998]|uniref:hypothetical protein n=1 Tax=Streptomyces sp. NPDC023998 TaxID=3154597 RepID=UPI0033E7AFA4